MSGTVSMQTIMCAVMTQRQTGTPQICCCEQQILSAQNACVQGNTPKSKTYVGTRTGCSLGKSKYTQKGCILTSG